MCCSYLYNYFCCFESKYKCCKRKYSDERKESKDWQYPKIFRREPMMEPQKNPMHMTEQELFAYIIG